MPTRVRKVYYNQTLLSLDDISGLKITMKDTNFVNPFQCIKKISSIELQ